MRHRFHSICPYFAMFPETFVEKHLAASKHEGVVFDPFCGRGTTVFESLIQGRYAAGSDVNPVAVCISGAKSDPPSKIEVVNRLAELQEACPANSPIGSGEENQEFFEWCYAPRTLTQLLFLRRELNWKTCRTDRFVAALALGALHGESHRSPNYFSNRMPRTISTKPQYSVRWWKANKCSPPDRDVFEILGTQNEYRFRTPPPDLRGEIRMTDVRKVSTEFAHLQGKVTDIITSPPYLDTTNYLEDQWLRLWFLGDKPSPNHAPGDGRHHQVDRYWDFLEQAWSGINGLMSDDVRVVVRIGGRRLSKDKICDGLLRTISVGVGRRAKLVDSGVTSMVANSQAATFLGKKPSSTVEHDFTFSV